MHTWSAVVCTSSPHLILANSYATTSVSDGLSPRCRIEWNVHALDIILLVQ